MGIEDRQATVGDCLEWRNIVLEVKVHNGLWCVRSRRRNPIQSLNELNSVCIT